MARRLGANAWHVPSLARTARERRPIASGQDLCAAEIRAHLRWGAVLHLEDLLLRRVRLGMWAPEQAAELAPRLRSVVRHELGWDGSRWERELADFNQALTTWKPEGLVDDPAAQPTSVVEG
jgi:glycerol-3-phosphate dehydrogenase